MVIFGTLEYFNPIDVMAMLRAQSGVLRLTLEDNYEIFAENNRILEIRRNARCLDSPKEIDNFLETFARQRSGSFRINLGKKFLNQTNQKMKIDLKEAIFKTAKTCDLEFYADQFPDENMLFHVTKELDYGKLKPYFGQSVCKALENLKVSDSFSVKDFAEKMSSSTDIASEYLYKLELSGLVEPFCSSLEADKKQGKTQDVKLVFWGPVGAGKTTIVKTLSETPVLETDEFTKESIGKTTTTVALDFGTLELEGFKIYLFGTPGQERFSFLREILMKGASAFILMIPGNKPETFPYTRRILHHLITFSSTPFAIAVTHQDSPQSWAPDEIAIYMQVPQNKAVALNPTNKTECLKFLRKVLALTGL